MAFRLGNYIVCGEIFNTTPYSVHGWLELRGREHPLVLQLTGNCSPDLVGWHFRFEARPPADASAAEDEPGDLEMLALQQIGPTGTMTATRRVRGSGRHPHISAERPEAPQTPEESRCLYLEWFSQNGRVLIELVDPVLEFVEYQAGDSTSLPTGSISETLPPVPSTSAEPVASVESPLETVADEADQADADDIEEEGEYDEEPDDPFQLFPRDLQLQFDLEARETDWNLQEDDEKPPMLREMELMDDLIENNSGVPLSELFEGPLQCPLPDQLQDAEVEEALKVLLAQLALYGVALDICQHFTPREAYRLLLEQICPEERAYPELRNTQWVQHYSTSDYCPQCQAELEGQFEDCEPGQEGEGADPEDPDDEIEF